MDTYLMTDQPETCPKCGGRTDFTEKFDEQHHTCMECGYKYIVEPEVPKCDKTGFINWFRRNIFLRRNKCKQCADVINEAMSHIARGEAFTVTFRPDKNPSGVVTFWHLDKPEQTRDLSWIETHHEVVASITMALLKDEPTVADQRSEAQGFGGVYELAEELTDEFEKLNKDRQWDGDFFDEIEAFLTKKLAL